MRLSLFSSKQCIIKQLLDSVLVISGIIKVEVSVISLRLIRDGPLEKLWGGGGGNFRAARIFFGYQILCMNFT